METAIFPGRFESLASIGAFVEEAAKAAGFDEMAVYAILMAVDEACSNIIDHAYSGENKGDITLSLEDAAGSFTVILEDTGRSFDPGAIPDPDLTSDLENRKIRGLGLYFIRKLMDEVHFEFSASGNRLTLVKHKSKRKPSRKKKPSEAST
jgi:anti-sigma regulatory factor (Ser/Thr protein kinase)